MYEGIAAWDQLPVQDEPEPRAPRIAPGRRTRTMDLPPRPVAAATATVVATPVQRREAIPGADDAQQRHLFDDALRPDLSDSVQTAAAHGIAGSGDVLPYLATLQPLFGRHDLSRVMAHQDGAAREGAGFLGAAAYATGDHVAFASAPDLHTAAHEAAHVIQQRGGVQLRGGLGARGDTYEQHADEIADRAVRGESVEALLDRHAGGGGSAGAPVQRLEYDELKVGRWYEVTGYSFPMFLRARRVKGGATLQPDERLPATVELPFDQVVREVPAPTVAPTEEEAAQRVVLGAIWDAHARVQRVCAVVAPALEDVVDPSVLTTKVRGALRREGKELLRAFHKNLISVGVRLGTQLAGSDLRFTSTAQRNTPGAIGETARTDLDTGKMTLYKAFFDNDRVARGNTMAHEMVHAALKCDDQAYKGSRIFEYLKPEYRLQNPDSYVQLLDELDPKGGNVKEAPGFELAPSVEGLDPAQIKRDLAIAQHVAQRGSYLLDACAAELTSGLIPAFMSQSAHLKAYIQVIGGNPKWADKKEDGAVLRDWAKQTVTRQRRVVSFLAADIKVVAKVDDTKAGTYVEDPDGGSGYHLLYFAHENPPYWLNAKVLQKLGFDGFVFYWGLAAAIVDKLEPFGAKFTLD